MKGKKFFTISVLFFIIIMIILSISFASAENQMITAPGQPASGPGGADYPCKGFVKSSYGVGAYKYWIYEPTSPQPASAPVIIFNHGFGAIYPEFYQGWIEHLVKKGNIVIYPQYQEIITPSEDFTPNAVNAVKNALKELETGSHVRPQLDKIAIVGHSAGGIISINMAALASSQGLPQPKAVFCVEPGTDESRKNKSMVNISEVPSNTLILTLAGVDDGIVGSEFSKTIIRDTTQVPLENKDYVLMFSDYHGTPSLIADHILPLSVHIEFFNFNLTLMTNTLDFYGIWKLFDGLYEAAFYNRNQEYALGNTSQQRYMGLWSDGTPVKELMVTNNP
ncbi:MAG: alpha/beta hydrolase fold domain-containing protein [Methanobacterium sp.]|nr:alpha/beta hydrolase fold domain-containing protein [Methanobacterium sp.]